MIKRTRAVLSFCKFCLQPIYKDSTDCQKHCTNFEGEQGKIITTKELAINDRLSKGNDWIGLFRYSLRGFLVPVNALFYFVVCILQVKGIKVKVKCLPTLYVPSASCIRCINKRPSVNRNSAPAHRNLHDLHHMEYNQQFSGLPLLILHLVTDNLLEGCLFSYDAYLFYLLCYNAVIQMDKDISFFWEHWQWL